MPDPEEQLVKPHSLLPALETTASRSPKQTTLAAVVLVGLCGWVVWRFGGLDFERTVSFAGRQVSVVDTFASVDHPFHATRAATLLQSLRDGNVLRWIGDHQGGYPVEFYPLGVAWFEVALWALAFGSVPIIAIHKLAILLIFVLPALGFWILARGDHLNPWLPVLATALHVSIPGGLWTNGGWTRGGYEELVRWGLVTNVGGATLALIASAALARAVIHGKVVWGAVAAIATAAAVYTNPRSLLAIVITAAGIALSAMILRRSDPASSSILIIRRIALVGAVSALLAAPVLVPLIRYRDLYFFVHYERYTSLSDYWTNLATAVSPPVLIIALGGVVLAVGSHRYPIARAFALALLGYALLTAALSANDGLIEQLEPPRLMPFQRFLTIYLAAFGITQAIEALVRFFRIGRPMVATGSAIGLATAAVLLLLWGSIWTPPEDYRTLDADTTAEGTFVPEPGAQPESEFLAFQEAVRAADRARPEGTAILVIGNREDRLLWWHEQLWAPLVSNAPFFYDDWLWYWHTDHEGPYNYLNGHAYPDPAQTFEPAYLQAHGIGVVVVTNMDVPVGATDPREAAEGDPDLSRTDTVGNWDVYAVVDPMTIISSDTSSLIDVTVEDDRLSAEFANASGEIDIRRNWFPRWQAFADGEPVDVTRTDNGYMRISVPSGTTTVELRYGTAMADWMARLAVVVGLVLTGVLRFLWGGSELRRLRASVVHTDSG